jgi:putative flippase GtrA
MREWENRDTRQGLKARCARLSRLDPSSPMPPVSSGVNRASRDETSASGRGLRRPTWASTLQVRRFAAVGVINTVVDYIVFAALTKLFQIPLDWVWTAKVVSGTVAISISFYLNRRWVFQVGGGRIGQAARFIAVTVVGVYCIQTPLTQLFVSYYGGAGKAVYAVLEGLGLAAAFPWLLTEALAIKTVAFVLATSISATFNFVAYRFWVFRTSAGPGRPTAPRRGRQPQDTGSTSVPADIREPHRPRRHRPAAGPGAALERARWEQK